MLRTLSHTKDWSLSIRVAGIVFFTLLTALSAQVEIWFGGPVQFTLQVLTVLLAGMVLGARDGALSIVAYVGLIILNFPVAAGGAGAVALASTSTSAGYIIGFIPSAFVTGWLVEHSGDRTWQRWLAGIVGIAIIYLFGIPVLYIVTGAENLHQAWMWGGYPFLGLDILKALIAATLTESARLVILRQTMNK